MNKKHLYACTFGLLTLITSCNSGSKTTETDSSVDTVMASNDTVTVVGKEDSTLSDSPTGMRGGSRAVATIASASGSSVMGTVTFTASGDNKVKMVLSVNGAPAGTHGVHLHQKGDCSAADASSAGPHWNPTSHPHGQRGTGQFHQGDLPNLTVGQDGNGRMEIEVEGWTIGGSDTTRSIENRAIVIHEKADDYKTQPSGDSGKRIGCGVIALQAEEPKK